jgi:hypothetical protein
MLHLEDVPGKPADITVQEPLPQATKRSVADFRAARRKRKEKKDQNSSLHWLGTSGQAHLLPLLGESRKRAVDERSRLPLTRETILEVDSSTDFDFG